MGTTGWTTAKMSKARGIAAVMSALVCGCVGDIGEGREDAGAVGSLGDELAPGGGTYSMRFETAVPECGAALFDANAPCPATDSKCICKPELAAIDTVIPRHHTGQVTGDQIEWLDAIAAESDRPVLVFGHHHQTDSNVRRMLDVN